MQGVQWEGLKTNNLVLSMNKGIGLMELFCTRRDFVYTKKNHVYIEQIICYRNYMLMEIK